MKEQEALKLIGEISKKLDHRYTMSLFEREMIGTLLINCYLHAIETYASIEPDVLMCLKCAKKLLRNEPLRYDEVDFVAAWISGCLISAFNVIKERESQGK